MWKVFSSFGSDFDWRNNVLMPSGDRLEGKAFGKRFAVHTVGEKLGRGHPIGQCDCWSFVVAKGFRSTFSLDRTDLWDLRPMDSISGSNNRFSWVYSQVQKGDYLPVQKKYDWPYDQLPAPSKIPGAALEFPLENWVSLTTYVCIWTMRCARPVGIMAPHWRLLSMPLSLWAGLFLKTSLTQYAPVW